MKKQLWIMGVDLRGQTVVRWYIEQTNSGWTLKCDAAGMAPGRFEPFETCRGRYELVALFLTPGQFEAGKTILERITKKLKTEVPPPAVGDIPVKPLKERQREVLLLYEMGMGEQEIAEANNISVWGVKQVSYRLRKQYGFTKTNELIKFFRASNKL